MIPLSVQTSISVQREGVYYGQCSEICGTNHAFTPIVVEAVSRKDYGSRVSNQLIPPQEGGAFPIISASPHEEPLALMFCSGADSGASSSWVPVPQAPLLPAPEGGSPATPSSTSTSLVGHPSSENNSDKFLTPESSPGSGATPDNQSSNSSPNTEQKESLEFLSENERSFWKGEVIRTFNEVLEVVDPQGRVGRIPEEEVLDALHLDSPFLTRGEMEKICKALRNTPWPSYDQAERVSIYASVWNLLERSSRPEI